MASATKVGTVSGARKIRLLQIDEMIRKGNPTVHELAQIFECDTYTIQRDLDVISQRWIKTQPKRLSQRRQRRIKQLEYVYNESIRAYELSKDGGTEEVITKSMKDCPRCEGDGTNGKSPCPRCKGSGEIIKTKIEYIEKELPGETKHLNQAIQVIREIAKIQGLNAPTKKEVKNDTQVTGGIAHAHVHAIKEYDDASPELIHNALAAISQLKGNAVSPQEGQDHIDPKKVIEAVAVGDDFSKWEVPQEDGEEEKEEPTGSEG